jgi:hypothetical protein
MSAVSEDDGIVDISPSGRPLFAAAGQRVMLKERIGLARRFAPAPALGRRPLTTQAEVDVPRSRR